MAEYTPTTDEVRDSWRRGRVWQLGSGKGAEAEFDRWLTAHDRRVAAGSLRDAAADIRTCYLVAVHAPTVERYLTSRARNIAAGVSPTETQAKINAMRDPRAQFSMPVIQDPEMNGEER